MILHTLEYIQLFRIDYVELIEIEFEQIDYDFSFIHQNRLSCLKY